MEVNQSPSLSLDTPVDIKVKERVITDTLQLLLAGMSTTNTSNNNSSSIGFWRIYPTRKNTESFKKFFCFPFPEDLFTGGQGSTSENTQGSYLDADQTSQLLALLAQDENLPSE